MKNASIFRLLAGQWAMALAGLVAASRRVWWALLAVAVLAGVFVTAQHGGLIRHGWASAAARGDYWRGAVAIARDHPLFGTGPGTFGSIYPKYKTATTEEAQLVHNSYLQMASDSGAAGPTSIRSASRRACRSSRGCTRWS